MQIGNNFVDSVRSLSRSVTFRLILWITWLVGVLTFVYKLRFTLEAALLAILFGIVFFDLLLSCILC